MEDKIKIGTIVNTFGIKGELKVKSYSDFNELRFKKNNRLFIDDIEVIVASYREHKGMVIVSFKGLQDINLVEKYKNCDIYILKSDCPQLDDGYYYHELYDLDVFDEDENYIGFVSDIEEGVAHNNLRIEKEDGSECLIPFIQPFILGVDLEEGFIIVKVIEGLL